MTLEESKVFLVKIESALFSGAQTAQVGDRRIEYRSIDEMRALVDILRRDIQKLEDCP